MVVPFGMSVCVLFVPNDLGCLLLCYSIVAVGAVIVLNQEANPCDVRQLFDCYHYEGLLMLAEMGALLAAASKRYPEQHVSECC